MDLTFRTIGPWGSGKGSNLAPNEVDQNFWNIAQAIVDLTADPALPVGIATIAVSGTQMTIHLTDGTVLGPFTLPVLTFRWRGEWTPSTTYAVLDVVTNAATGIYMVQIAHTSGATFDGGLLIGGLPAFLMLFGMETPDTAIADGNMVSNISGVTAFPSGHTLTAYLDHVISATQGAVMYRSGSAWIALGPGTAGQFLATGGAAANVSWSNPPAGIPGGVDSVGTYTAAGTNQSSATALTTLQSYVSGATGTNGVVLDPTLMVAGVKIVVANEHVSNDLLFYPGLGMTINNQAINTPITIPANGSAMFAVKSATQIRSVP